MQVMILLHQKELLTKAMKFFIRNTITPTPEIPDLKRDSVYHIYERYFCDDAIELGTEPVSACGPLNIVCVAEILKTARMIAGIEPNDDGFVVHPYLPEGWTGVSASGIPCLKNGTLTYTDISQKLL